MKDLKQTKGFTNVRTHVEGYGALTLNIFTGYYVTLNSIVYS